MWGVCDLGLIACWDGERWSTHELDGRPIISDVWGSGMNDVWVVCLNGQIFRHAAGHWMVVHGPDWDDG